MKLARGIFCVYLLFFFLIPGFGISLSILSDFFIEINKSAPENTSLNPTAAIEPAPTPICPPSVSGYGTITSQEKTFALSGSSSGLESPPPAPPVQIHDLKTQTGAGSGQVYLSWTAPLKSDRDGAEKSLSIRFLKADSQFDLDWKAAAAAVLDPGPFSANSRQTVIVSGLIPGQAYIFRLQAETAEGNILEISNAAVGISREAPDLLFRPEINGFGFANQQLARSWDMFARFYPVGELKEPDGTISRRALQTYNRYRYVGGGFSCLGFSAASLFSFLNTPQPQAGPYAIPHFDRLIDQPKTDALANSIAYYSAAQTSRQYWMEYALWNSACDLNAAYTLEIIANAIQKGSSKILVLQFDDTAYHAVLPYRVWYHSEDQATVFVYDSESPGLEREVGFNRSGGKWLWSYEFSGSLSGLRSGGCANMFLVSPEILVQEGQLGTDWN